MSKKLKRIIAVFTAIILAMSSFTFYQKENVFAASNLAAKLTINGSTASKTVSLGDSVKFSVAASGGNGGYTYKFAVLDVKSGKWTVLRNFGSSSFYTYGFNFEGEKQFAVTVKDITGNTVSTNRITIYVGDCSKELSGSLKVGGSTNALTKNVGSSIKLDASASGGSGSYTYKFAVLNVKTGKWSVLRNFSTSSTYTYALNYTGTKQFAVTVKDSKGKTVSTNRITVNVIKKLSASLKVGGSTNTISKLLGSSVKLDASASGGSGGYTYKFAVLNVSTKKWTVLKNFSTTSTYTYNLKYKGTKQFAVTVKDSAGNTVSSDRLTVKVYPKLSGSLKVGGLTTTVNRKVGETIKLDASASGGSGSYTYKFAVLDADRGNWYVLKDFSTTSTYTFECKYKGTKQFAVTVKDSMGNTVATNRIDAKVAPKTVSTTGVSLNTNSVTINKGGSTTLTATVYPGDASNKSVTWSSSNTSVATVSGGKVTGVGSGTATITVKTAEGGYTASCTVKVNVPTTGVSLNTNSITINKGGSTTLTATVYPGDASNKSVTWSSSNTSVATVSGGKVTGVGNGTATITVKTAEGGYTASCTVKVNVPTTGVSITNKKTLALDCNSLSNHTYQCAVSVAPSDASNKNVTWSSSNTGVATVDSTGKITGVGRGTATITVKAVASGHTDSFTVYVYKSNEDIPPYGTIYYKVSISSTTNRVMDVYDGNTYNGAKVQLWSLNTSDAQLWQFHDYRASNGGIAIVPKCNSGAYILDVHRGGNNYTDTFKENNLIDLWTLGEDNAASMWELVRIWDGCYVFRLVGTNWVAGVTSTAEGAQLMLRKFDPFDSNQKWCLEAVEVKNDAVTQKITELRNRYKHGQYWNKYNGLDKTGTIACPCGNGTCPYNCACNCGEFNYNGTPIAWQCHGFALKMAYEVFGDNANNWEKHTNVNSIYAGDVVRINNDGHSIFITKVDGDNIYYVDCNYTGRCQVRWDGCYTRSQLSSRLTFIRHRSGNTSLGK